MSTFSIFLVLIVIVAFLLVIVIMVQNPKGGGLSSSFGGGGTQQIGGVKKTSDFLDKSTWALATLLLALILLSNVAIGGANGATESKALDQSETTKQPLPSTDNTSNNKATPAETNEVSKDTSN
jgi:preprotein translocase subunit SecG